VSDQTAWYLARSSGIVALVLLVASLLWGVLLSTRLLKPYDRPAWLLDLHRWLGGTALAMTSLHLLGLFLDKYIVFGPRQLFIPGASSYRPLAVSFGVVSLYLLLAIEITSLLRKHLSKRVWHGVHLTSYLLTWTAVMHGATAGTDATSHLYQGIALLLTVVAGAAAMVRLARPRRRSASAT
jgi:sulfoxide reductase heme-binding subunit YedZ